MKWWDESFNPVVGCSPVSLACDFCYAARDAHNRLAKNLTPGIADKYAGLTELVEDLPRRKPPVFVPQFNGIIRVCKDEKIWTRPFHWRRPRTVFVSNMGDLFHKNTPPEAILRVFDVIADPRAQRHLFLLCTKRPENVWRFFKWFEANNYQGGALGEALAFAGRLDNVWIGTTVENHPNANGRLPFLRELRPMFGGTFISYEPALGPVYWESALPPLDPDFPVLGRGVDWIVAGCESGPEARPSHPDWIRSTRDFCVRHDVHFTFKQWGEWYPIRPAVNDACEDDEVPLGLDGTNCRGMKSLMDVSTVVMKRLGRKRAGHKLDGRVHEFMPRPEGVLT